MRVGQDTPVSELVDLLRHAAPTQARPRGWHHWLNVREAHVKLLTELRQNIPEYSGPTEGRCILSCVSAKSGHSSGKHLNQGYFPGAWVQLHELRRLGCTLPVVWAHLGPLEFDPFLRKLVEPYGVQVIDLRAWEAQQSRRWRILAGWETKIAAVIACPYDEILFMDADNTAVRNPIYLFDDPIYRSKSAVFWPDVPPHDRKEWLPEFVWKAVGLEYRPDELDFESGQFMVRKSKCWREVCVTRWLNEYSDYYYTHVFGDKSTFHLGWAVEGRDYGFPDRAPGWNGGAIIQYDLEGRKLFEHGCQNKPDLNGYPKRNCVSYQVDCDSHLEKLRQLWNGKLWSSINNDHNEGVQKILGKTFLYKRIGLDQRQLRFIEDGRIGRGAKRMEMCWSMIEDDGLVLVVSDYNETPTAMFRECPDGVWRGKWIEHERCDCELVPEMVPEPV